MLSQQGSTIFCFIFTKKKRVAWMEQFACPDRIESARNRKYIKFLVHMVCQFFLRFTKLFFLVSKNFYLEIFKIFSICFRKFQNFIVKFPSLFQCFSLKILTYFSKKQETFFSIEKIWNFLS